MSSKKYFQHILSRFDGLNLPFVMAYGSGAFEQAGYSKNDKPMIDFVFAVNDICEFHEKNLTINPTDYSKFSRIIGAKGIESLTGDNVFYNPFVKFQDREIKYGVMDLNYLAIDLDLWNKMYIAGRLHKPANIIRCENKYIEYALEMNLKHAVNTSLFLLPEKFSLEDFFRKIASLSYKGDVRERLGMENPQKIENIIIKNHEWFEETYLPRLKKEQNIHISDKIIVTQDKSKSANIQRFKRLPTSLNHGKLEEEITENDLNDVENRLRSIVFKSSIRQPILGIASAGVGKSINYAMEKRKKGKIKAIA